MYLVSQRCVGDAAKNYEGGTPPSTFPPYALKGKSLCQKKLSGKGVPPLPLTESPQKSYPEKNVPKRAKNGVVFNKVRNGPKRPFNGLKSAKKKGKII